MTLDLWFSVVSYNCRYICQHINKQIEFFFHQMGSMTNKMQQTFSAGALPRIPLRISQPHSQKVRGYPCGGDTPSPTPSLDAHDVSTWVSPPATHFHFNHWIGLRSFQDWMSDLRPSLTPLEKSVPGSIKLLLHAFGWCATAEMSALYADNNSNSLM